ncbi:hypothetical protein L0U88_12140 [Flavihumibacter sp. RY-1]|uniref:DUF4136 domain-containing protein n=1 Tax=Flavihumibacter fluminis TaxID=2909236 RepID=A0ABS9BI24_9BACT|nr:hypothetical protein [Flavihumibacter fluminis]MCF1715377.1 hypothetical protein [Flavihumibacter fluminis]
MCRVILFVDGFTPKEYGRALSTNIHSSDRNLGEESMYKNIFLFFLVLIFFSACETATITSQTSSIAPVRPGSKIYIKKSDLRSIENQNIESSMKSWLENNSYKLVQVPSEADFTISYTQPSNITTQFNYSINEPVTTRATGFIGSTPINISQTGFETRNYTEQVTNRTISFVIVNNTGKNAGEVAWAGGIGTSPDSLLKKTPILIDKLFSQIGKTTTTHPVIN